MPIFFTRCLGCAEDESRCDESEGDAPATQASGRPTNEEEFCEAKSLRRANHIAGKRTSDSKVTTRDRTVLAKLIQTAFAAKAIAQSNPHIKNIPQNEVQDNHKYANNQK